MVWEDESLYVVTVYLSQRFIPLVLKCPVYVISVVYLIVGRQQQQSIVAADQGRNPRWNQEFIFTVECVNVWPNGFC